MTRHRVGLWLVGAFGGVGTTITLGLAAMARGLADRTGLVTELPLFRRLAAARAGRFRDRRPRHPPDVVRGIGRGISPQLGGLRGRVDHRVSRRAGGGHGAGPARHPFRRRAARSPTWDTGATPKPPQTARQAVDRIAADMAAFVDAESIDHMIVLNVASTEPPFVLGRGPPALGHLERRAGRRRPRAASRQLALRPGRLAVRLHLHQLHAQPGRLAPRPRRAGAVDRLALCRQGRQDRRDA